MLSFENGIIILRSKPLVNPKIKLFSKNIILPVNPNPASIAFYYSGKYDILYAKERVLL